MCPRNQMCYCGGATESYCSLIVVTFSSKGSSRPQSMPSKLLGSKNSTCLVCRKAPNLTLKTSFAENGVALRLLTALSSLVYSRDRSSSKLGSEHLQKRWVDIQTECKQMPILSLVHSVNQGQRPRERKSKWGQMTKL